MGKIGGYMPISRLSGFFLRIILRVWAYSGLVLVFCCLLYYMYGGMLALLMLFFAVTGILYRVQDNLLYSPELPSHSRVYIPKPSLFGLPFESVNIKCSDNVVIHAYFIYQPGGKQKTSPTIVFFHGNAGNMGHRLQNCVELYQQLHCNILLVEYRGYGFSEGSPSEEGLYTDAQASIDYLYKRNDINKNEIIVFGRSLGGAVAIDLCTRDNYNNKIWCLIVENTFTSIPDMAKVLLRWKFLKYLPIFCYKNKFLSNQKVRQLRIPTFFISGAADGLVPPSMMSELYNRCSSIRKQLLRIPGGTHNETWQKPGYYHAVDNFLKNCRLAVENKFINNFDKENQAYCENSIWSNVENV